jgi:hypothetical protein
MLSDAPLSGLRIIEVSSFIAAPLGGMTLAQLGAEVIRIDPSSPPTPARSPTPWSASSTSRASARSSPPALRSLSPASKSLRRLLRSSARTRAPSSRNCGCRADNRGMRRLTDTDGLTEVQRDILRTVRDFVDAEVIPVAPELEHADVRADAAHREGTAEIQKMIIGRALVRDY